MCTAASPKPTHVQSIQTSALSGHKCKSSLDQTVIPVFEECKRDPRIDVEILSLLRRKGVRGETVIRSPGVLRATGSRNLIFFPGGRLVQPRSEPAAHCAGR